MSEKSRIRELENEIGDLEKKLHSCTEKERYKIKRKIDDLKSELRRFKRRREDDDDGVIGIGLSILGLGLRNFGGFGSGGDSHGFGSGRFGGGGSGGSW
jgi:ribosome-interacting GTPase 1